MRSGDDGPDVAAVSNPGKSKARHPTAKKRIDLVSLRSSITNPTTTLDLQENQFKREGGNFRSTVEDQKGLLTKDPM